MGFFGKVLEIAGFLIEEGAKNQGQMQKKADNKMKEYDRKISDAEKSEKMKNPEYAKKVNEAKQKLESAKVGLYSKNNACDSNIKLNSSGEVTVGGKTIDQWDRQWQKLGILSNLSMDDLRPYNHHAGLYKAVMNGKIYYIGRAVEYNNGGFRKRLRDYVRDSESARTHKSGKQMHENADRIQLSILVVGSSDEAVEITKVLEKALIRKYTPQWNIQHNS